MHPLFVFAFPVIYRKISKLKYVLALLLGTKNYIQHGPNFCHVMFKLELVYSLNQCHQNDNSKLSYQLFVNFNTKEAACMSLEHRLFF